MNLNLQRSRAGHTKFALCLAIAVLTAVPASVIPCKEAYAEEQVSSSELNQIRLKMVRHQRVTRRELEILAADGNRIAENRLDDWAAKAAKKRAARPNHASHSNLPARIAASPRLRALRTQMVKGQSISSSSMRSLADAGDGLAAYRLAERIDVSGGGRAISDAAHYYSIAVFYGRSFAVKPLVALLARPDFQARNSRLDHIEQALKREAEAGDDQALLSLAKLYQLGTPFGRHPDKADAMLKEVAERRKDGVMALKVATDIANAAPLTSDELSTMRHFLTISSKSDRLGVRAAAENLLRMFPAGPSAIQAKPSGDL